MGEEPVKGDKQVACPYYREPKAGELIGCCNGNLAEIPSEAHQSCLWRSNSGIYVDFCPIHAKFQRKKSYTHKRGILRRIFLGRYGKLVYDDEPGEQVNHQAEPEKGTTQEEAVALEV